MPLHNTAKKKPRQAKHKSLTPQQLTDLRAFRSQYAKLKRKGVVKGDARKVKPTKKNKDIIKQFADVLSGKARVSKVKAADLAKLKAEGFKTRNRKVVASKDYLFRNGKTFLKGKKGARIYRVNPEDWEQSIRDIFELLKPKTGLAARIFGRATWQIYPNADLLINTFLYDYRRVAWAENPQVELFDPHETQADYHRKATEARNAALFSTGGKKGRAAARERAAQLAAFRASLRGA